DDRIAVVMADGVSVLDRATGAVLEHGPRADTFLGIVSPDGSTALSSAYDNVGYRSPVIDVWRVGTGKVSSLTVSAPPLQSVGCGRDTACVLTVNDHLVRVDYDDGAVASDVLLPRPVQPSLAASADGSQVAMPTPDGLLLIVDPRTGEIERALAGGSRDP